MRKELSVIAQNLEMSYTGDFSVDSFARMKNYLARKMKSPLRKSIAKQIVDNMDIIIKYTNMTNSDWYVYDEVLKQPNFLRKYEKVYFAKYLSRECSFYKKDGAQKFFTLAQGKEWSGGIVFD